MDQSVSKSVASKITKQDFIELVSQCSRTSVLDCENLYEQYKIHLSNHNSIELKPCKTAELQKKWYDSLEDPDFTVYEDPYYICDIWLCWVKYSRRYLCDISKPTSLGTRSIQSYIGQPKVIFDLGCGFGYTTALLKELFPLSKVVGTNLETSFQYEMAKQMGQRYGFEVHSGLDEIHTADLVFASEYFEHFQSPLEHLHDVLKKRRPKFLIIANGFNGLAIGHFNTYYHLGKPYCASDMGRMFNKQVSAYGYKKLKTKLWNNRPAIWVHQ